MARDRLDLIPAEVRVTRLAGTIAELANALAHASEPDDHGVYFRLALERVADARGSLAFIEGVLKAKNPVVSAPSPLPPGAWS